MKIAPVVDIALTNAPFTKLVPVIVTDVCALVMVSGDNDVTVGKVIAVTDSPFTNNVGTDKVAPPATATVWPD